MRDRNGHAVRQVPRVRPGAVGEARDLQVASTAIGTKPFAFPKAVRRAGRIGWARLKQVYLTLLRAIQHWGACPPRASFSALSRKKVVALSLPPIIGWLNRRRTRDIPSLQNHAYQGYLTLFKSIWHWR